MPAKKSINFIIFSKIKNSYKNSFVIPILICFSICPSAHFCKTFWKNLIALLALIFMNYMYTKIPSFGRRAPSSVYHTTEINILPNLRNFALFKLTLLQTFKSYDKILAVQEHTSSTFPLVITVNIDSDHLMIIHIY